MDELDDFIVELRGQPLHALVVWTIDTETRFIHVPTVAWVLIGVVILGIAWHHEEHHRTRRVYV